MITALDELNKEEKVKAVVPETTTTKDDSKEDDTAMTLSVDMTAANRAAAFAASATEQQTYIRSIGTVQAVRNYKRKSRNKKSKQMEHIFNQ
jgi:hypothetical protein